MKFLKLAMAAMVLVMTIAVVGCAKKESTTPAGGAAGGGATPPATETPANK